LKALYVSPFDDPLIWKSHSTIVIGADLELLQMWRSNY
jgi:hypothetical protein